MQIIVTADAPKAIGPYSQAIVSNGLVFCSGQIPLDLAGNVVGTTIQEQTHQVLKNLSVVLEAGGSRLNHVVKTTVFMRNLADFPLMNEIYAEYFGEHKPARATVEVSKLPKDVLIEIECVATLL